jgi:probable rRNA maturation factor
MINIDISSKFEATVNPSLLEKAAQTTIEHQEAPSGSSLSLVISDDDHLRQLNQQFNDISEPTDVLSFPADLIDPDINSPYIGDVVISYSRAKEQAANIGHSVEAELQLLVVHGVLHLLGHDHFDEQGKACMWSAQSEILAELGVEI